MRPGFAVVGFVAALALAGEARAGGAARTRLVYDPTGVASCPTEEELRDAVAARLGYDPLTSDPGVLGEARIVVERRGRGIVGVLTLSPDGPSAAPARREIPSARGDCPEVVSALAVALAIGLDPTSLAPAPAAPPAPPIAERPAPPPRPTTPSRAPSPSLSARAQASALVAVGELPATTAMFAVGGSLRSGPLEAVVELLGALPATHLDPLGSVKASLVGVAAAPCGHVSWLFGCAAFTIGALRSEGDRISVTSRGTDLYAAAGARAGAEVPIGARLFVRASVEGVAPITRIALTLDEHSVWTVPALAVRAGATLGVAL